MSILSHEKYHKSILFNVVIVGALKLTPYRRLKEVNIIRQKHPTKEILQIFVTNFARPEIIEKAVEKG